MTTTRRLGSARDFENLRLAGGVVTSIAVGQYSANFTLVFEDARTAEIRIESGASISEGGTPPIAVDAGPSLGRELIGLLGEVIAEQGLDGSSLLLRFGNGWSLSLLVDESGYESYQIEVNGIVYVAMG